jgi:predicted molibdopterin-dependent oxidoreductase YjgC
MIFYAMGLTQHPFGTENVLAIANLALLTGNVGRPSTGVNPLRGQNNVQGACDMGALPDFLPGYQRLGDPRIREKFQAAWGTPIPEKPGLTVVEMFEAARTGEIKAMLIMGENPMVSDPEIPHVAEALKKLEFLVVLDIFPNETTPFAHVILPAASFAEKDGTFTNTERKVQRVRKALQPPGEAKPDWQIICELSTRLGYPMHYENPAAIMEEIARLTPIYGGISCVNPLRGQNNVQGACDMGSPSRFSPGLSAPWGSPDPREIPGWPGGRPSPKNQFTPPLCPRDPAGGELRGKRRDLYEHERKVQRVRKALQPPGEAKPDWQIICELSTRLGYPMHY